MNPKDIFLQIINSFPDVVDPDLVLDWAVNTFAVLTRAREGFLIERRSKTTPEQFGRLKTIITRAGLVVRNNNLAMLPTRQYTTRHYDDKALGTLLGFPCPFPDADQDDIIVVHCHAHYNGIGIEFFSYMCSTRFPNPTSRAEELAQYLTSQAARYNLNVAFDVTQWHQIAPKNLLNIVASDRQQTIPRDVFENNVYETLANISVDWTGEFDGFFNDPANRNYLIAAVLCRIYEPFPFMRLLPIYQEDYIEMDIIANNMILEIMNVKYDDPHNELQRVKEVLLLHVAEFMEYMDSHLIETDDIYEILRRLTLLWR